jgi:hypothetical protein
MKTELMSLIKESMLSKNEVRTRTLRLIKTEFMKFETAKNATILDESAEIDILKGMIKQRNQSVEQYTEANRFDLAEQENLEIEIIESFLPKMVSEDELKGAIIAAINVNNITDMRGIGIVMKSLKESYSSNFDAGLANKLFKQILSL